MTFEGWNEERRRIATRLAAHSSWWLAAVVTFGRATGYLADPWVAVLVLLVGAGISTSLALSRQRLSDTIVAAFHAGHELSRYERELRESPRHEQR